MTCVLKNKQSNATVLNALQWLANTLLSIVAILKGNLNLKKFLLGRNYLITLAWILHKILREHFRFCPFDTFYIFLFLAKWADIPLHMWLLQVQAGALIAS